MSQGDSWTERYLSVVPEKLTAADARVLIKLMCEDPERLAQALQALADEATTTRWPRTPDPAAASRDEAFGPLSRSKQKIKESLDTPVAIPPAQSDVCLRAPGVLAENQMERRRWQRRGYETTRMQDLVERKLKNDVEYARKAIIDRARVTLKLVKQAAAEKEEP